MKCEVKSLLLKNYGVRDVITIARLTTSLGTDMTVVARLTTSLGADMTAVARLTTSLEASHTDSETLISRLTTSLEPCLLLMWIRAILLELSEPDG